MSVPADPAVITALIHEGFAHHQAGALALAADRYRAALALDPDNLNGLQLLALIHLAEGRAGDAVALLERALALVESRPPVGAAYAALYNNLGDALRAAGRRGDALDRYRQGLLLDPAVPQLHGNVGIELLAMGQAAEAVPYFAAGLALAPDDADLLLNLACAQGGADQPEEALANLARYAALRPGDARALVASARIEQAQGQLSTAEAHCRAALELAPDFPDALLTLAMILTDARRLDEAAAACRALLAVDPANANAHSILGAALAEQGDLDGAIAQYQACLAIVPDHIPAHYQLGLALAKGGQALLALGFFATVVERFPDYASAHVEIGNLLQSLGRTQEAAAAFRRAIALRPITTWKNNGPAPDDITADGVAGDDTTAEGAAARPFSILILQAPGAFNTPPRYLLGKCPYDRHFYALMPGVEPDLDLLRQHGDAVFNLISDVDQGRDILDIAARVVDALGKPVVNPPHLIARTGRDTGLALLTGIPDLRAPHTQRHSREALADPALLAAIPYPILIRTAGTHGGDDFEPVADAAQLTAFVDAHPAAEYYLIEFVDYASPDGYYRKYRFLWVNGEMLPYHLAIGRHWKVHHFRTDMDKTPWMQAEEADFLDHPDKYFTPAHFAALHATAAAFGLDYLGIDCGIDPDGRLLVFEANATILIHDDNAAYPYKTPHVRRIKRAFDAMLTRAALGR